MRNFILKILVCISTLAFAQNSTAIKYASYIDTVDLENHLQILASDSLEGRATGQRGQKMAADYIANYFNSLGIPPYNGKSYYQEFPLWEQRIESSSLVLNEQLGHLVDYYSHPYFGSVDITFKTIQFGGYGIDSTVYSSFIAKDKVLLIYTGALLDDSYLQLNIDWEDQLEKAYLQGAKAVIFVDKGVKSKLKKYGHYFSKPKRSVFVEETKFKLPYAFIDENDIEETIGIKSKKLIKKINKHKYIEINVDGKFTNSVYSDKLEGENVLGYLEGSDLKDELLVITAHYDHTGIHNGEIHNGADDDGSGTVAVLDIAQAFVKAKEEGNGPRRSILFMPVSGEEMGLLGSSYYSENPIYPLENTIANLNIDMIGRMDEKHQGNPDYVYLIGSDKLSTELHSISEEANRDYMNLELDYTFNAPDDPNRFYYRSDHYNFAKNNIPVIFYFNGTHKDYHKATDTVEKIHFGKISKISKLIYYTAWQLVNQDKRIEVDVENDFKNNR